jgi:hypothetical protein
MFLFRKQVCAACISDWLFRKIKSAIAFVIYVLLCKTPDEVFNGCAGKW